MPEHQQTQKSTESKSTAQKQATSRIQTPVSHPMAIIQRARINPKSLTPADVLQLQQTIGNRAVGRLLSEIGLIPSKAKQTPTVQMQTIPEEEKEPLQGKMTGTIQRQETPEEEESLQGKFENKPEIACPSCFAAPIVQRQEITEEKALLQGKMIGTVQRQKIPEEEEPLQTKRENNTGMPDNLKAGVEGLSGIDMSDVRVHYNSSKPAEVGSLAYTQGTSIHVAPGQEKHLPHETWHVVQQMQERVKPTMQVKGVSINDDTALEREADVMGAQALQMHGADPIMTRPIADVTTLEPRKREPTEASGAPIDSITTTEHPLSFSIPVTQLTRKEVTDAQTLWTSWNNDHGVVNGILTGPAGEFQTLHSAYNALGAPFTTPTDQTTSTNQFLEDSAAGLLHDVQEIESHAGGYYWQQIVKDRLNASIPRNIGNQVGVRAGANNRSNPDLVRVDMGGTEQAIEAKRTTTSTGMKPLLEGAIEQLSLRSGFASAKAVIDITHQLQIDFVTTHIDDLNTWVLATVSKFRGWGARYWDTATPINPTLRSFLLTVEIKNNINNKTLFDRDYTITIGKRDYWSGRGPRRKHRVIFEFIKNVLTTTRR